MHISYVLKQLRQCSGTEMFSVDGRIVQISRKECEVVEVVISSWQVQKTVKLQDL